MGDATSSLFALGYHEKIDDVSANAPLFITELRKSTFGRIYWADKTMAVFLGRPPRIFRDYCMFKIPANIPGLWEDDKLPANSNVITDTGSDHQKEPINYTADARCAARFASIKEDILRITRRRHNQIQGREEDRVEETKSIALHLFVNTS